MLPQTPFCFSFPGWREKVEPSDRRNLVLHLNRNKACLLRCWLCGWKLNWISFWKIQPMAKFCKQEERSHWVAAPSCDAQQKDPPLKVSLNFHRAFCNIMQPGDDRARNRSWVVICVLITRLHFNYSFYWNDKTLKEKESLKVFQLFWGSAPKHLQIYKGGCSMAVGSVGILGFTCVLHADLQSSRGLRKPTLILKSARIQCCISFSSFFLPTDNIMGF